MLRDSGVMTTEQMRARLMLFAIDVLRLTRTLPDDEATRHVCRQVFRSASSVACNYRAASLARSGSEFVAKLGVVREEADETVFWFEFLDRAEMLQPAQAEGVRLRREAGEIIAMVSAAYRTSRQKFGKK